MTTRRRFLAAAVSAAALPGPGNLGQNTLLAESEIEAPTIPGSDTLLLVDDHHVLYRAGTKRLFHPLKRHPANPVISGKQKPWEVAIAFNSVYRDPGSGRYQMWYQSYAGSTARARTESCTVSYAESKDGINWIKPELGLYPFNDVKATNIVLIANGGTSDRYGASVIFDPEDADRGRRYKMVYFDFSLVGGKYYPGLSAAFSADGIHWNKYPQAPLLRASYGTRGDPVPFSDEPDARGAEDMPLTIADAFDVCRDPLRGEFAIYGKMWIDGPDGRMYWKHAAHRALSKDLIHWDRPTLCMAPDDQDPAWVEFHTTPVFFYCGCYFAAPQILHRDKDGGVMNVELAISRDGLNFCRPFRKEYWLPRTENPRLFDGGTVLTNSTPVILDDEIRIYYGGYSAGATGGDDYGMVSGIGLATMPRDRFAGVRPTDHIGQVTLKPLDLSKSRKMTVNADASAGVVRVELLNDKGYRIRGFSREDAEPISGDSLRHAVTWKSKTLRDLPSGRYMPRMHLENAEVFAITLL